jgi:hypothetical protein
MVRHFCISKGDIDMTQTTLFETLPEQFNPSGAIPELPLFQLAECKARAAVKMEAHVANISFEQFKASRVRCDDLGGYFKDPDCEEVAVGYLYGEGDMYIEDLGGRYCLTIANEITCSCSLDELERKLYAYGCAEGLCEVAA